MAKIKISIIDPSGKKRTKVGLPDDVEIQRLLNGLLFRLDLPLYDRNGHFLNYYLIRNDQDKIKLQSNQTLAEADIQENDELRLVAEQSSIISPSQNALILPYISAEQSSIISPSQNTLILPYISNAAATEKSISQHKETSTPKKLFDLLDKVSETSSLKSTEKALLAKAVKSKLSEFGGTIDLSQIHKLLLQLQKQSDSQLVELQKINYFLGRMVFDPSENFQMSAPKGISSDVGEDTFFSDRHQQKSGFDEEFHDRSSDHHRQPPGDDTTGSFRVHIYISSDPEDRKWLKKLLDHLEYFKVVHGFQIWCTENIRPGRKKYTEIFQAIENSKVGVCIVSKSFLKSEFIQKNEVPRMLRYQKDREMIIIPILVGHCAWELLPWLTDIKIYPQCETPLSKYTIDEQDEMFVIVVKEINEIFFPRT